MLVNPFVSTTKRAGGRAATLGRYTDSALSAPGNPAEIAALYAAYHPVWEVFKNAYYERSSKGGEQVGKVAGMKEQLRALSDNIKEWALAIEQVHRKGTPGYVTLLPQGRHPFRNGSKTERIATVDALVLSLAEQPELSALHTEVAAFAMQLKTFNADAEGKKGGRRSSSVSLERARLALCSALYAVLGGLINLYPDEPHRVSLYFDIATMHRHRHRKGKSEEAS